MCFYLDSPCQFSDEDNKLVRSAFPIFAQRRKSTYCRHWSRKPCVHRSLQLKASSFLPIFFRDADPQQRGFQTWRLFLAEIELQMTDCGITALGCSFLGRSLGRAAKFPLKIRCYFIVSVGSSAIEGVLFRALNPSYWSAE